MSQVFAGAENIDIETASAFVYNIPFTLACWVKTPSSAPSDGQYAAIGYGDSSATVNYMYLGYTVSAGVMSAYAELNATTSLTNTFNTLSTNTWYHLAASFTSGGGVSTITPYFNGAVQTTSSSGSVLNPTMDTSQIGAVLKTSYTNYFHGTLAQCASWTRAVSAEQIASMASNFSPKFYPVSLAWYNPCFSTNPEIMLWGPRDAEVISSTGAEDVATIYPWWSYCNTTADLDNSLTMTAASRTTGVVPLAVFFDAVDTASPSWTSGVVQPADEDYSSFHYTWDFGDEDAGNWDNGRSKNYAIGYTAAHVYETPGTYTVRLTVINSVGHNQVYEQQVTASAFSGTTYYVSSSSGNDGNTGLSPAQAFQNFSAGVAAVATNRRILFKRGDTWSITTGKTLDANGPGIIGAYYNSDGTDDPLQAKPQITHTSDGRVFTFNPGNDDWTVMNLHLVGTSSSTTSAIGYGNGTQKQSLCLRLDLNDVCTGFQSSWSNQVRSENFIVECSTTDMGSPSGGNHYFIYCYQMAIMGCTGYGVQGDGEHIVRIFHARKTYIADNDFGTPAGSKHVLKLHNDDGISPALPDGQYINICHNKFVDGGGWMVTVGPQDDTSDETISDVIIDGNLCEPQGDGTAFMIWSSNVTARNNVIWGDGASIYFDAFGVSERGIEGDPDNVRIYNNTFYRGDDGEEFIMLRLGTPTNVYFYNNLASAPNWTGGTKELINNALGTPINSGSNLLTDTAGFVDADAGDFSLDTGSAAIDAGEALTHVRVDFDGVSRPVGSDYDIGAFESA